MQMHLLRCFSIALLLLCNGAANADDVAIKAGIARMMDVGWSVTPTARAAADAQYIELQATAAGDERLLTASVLVLLQQRRYEEAGKRLDELLTQDADNILALRAKTWLAATMKSYGGAIVTAEKLRAALPVESTQDPTGEAIAQDQLAFLGRLCGYLAGPVADGVDQAERKQLEKTVLMGLGDERRLVFEQARDGVTQKFFELTDTKSDQEKKNVEDRKVEANQTLQDVETARKEIESRASELEASATKLQKEWNDELAEIERADRPLVAELARLRARADIIGRDLASYQIQIDSLNVRFARERDPVIRNQIARDIDQLSFLANRISGDLAAINRQGQAVESQRGVLAQRVARAQANFGGQLDRINKELVALGKKEKRADYEEKKAKRPVSGSSTKTIALSSQVTALSTYDKFPLEQARQRLLNELK
jgi:predicted  nucleic acid-binding Zn-ribbon protein